MRVFLICKCWLGFLLCLVRFPCSTLGPSTEPGRHQNLQCDKHLLHIKKSINSCLHFYLKDNLQVLFCWLTSVFSIECCSCLFPFNFICTVFNQYKYDTNSNNISVWLLRGNSWDVFCIIFACFPAWRSGCTAALSLKKTTCSCVCVSVWVLTTGTQRVRLVPESCYLHIKQL